MKLGKKLRLVNGTFVVACALALAWFVIPEAFYHFFSSKDFMPHGHCYLWQPGLVWTMVITNLLIGLAYVSIATCLYVLVRRINLPFSAMFLAFGAFIAACGGTHFVEIYTLWIPNYWLSAFINVITAIASVATAVIMFPLFPKVIHFATAARLSEERRLQLEAANRELEKRTDELTIANRELEAFSYSVSHDLRSPLRGINGFSKALLEDYSDKLNEEGKQYLKFIANGSQRMGRIIDDLLNLSKITRQDVQVTDASLTEFAKDTIENLRSADPNRKVEVFIQEGLQVKGDPGLLRIVVENLLSNAWKFSSKSVGARIEVGAQLKDAQTVFFVRDNGAGFDMQFSDKLFGAFQRLHSVEEFEGTGIGLATAKRILTKHGGSIWAESAPGKGTTFYFTVGSAV